MNSKLFLFVFSALVSYLVAGINPAILLSKMIYHQDIRTLGSKNPGFTNFKRVFGNRYAWYVFALDILKNLVLCLIFCPLFQNIMQDGALGAAYVGLCAMLGHAFPVPGQPDGCKAVCREKIHAVPGADVLLPVRHDGSGNQIQCLK